MGKNILVIGNGYIADNFIFSVKDKYNVTTYARNKNMEYNNVTYIYDSIENIDLVQNNFNYIYILFGNSRPNINDKLNEVLYTNVYLVSKILDYAKKNMSKIFYPATSLSLSNNTNNLNYYSYSHTITIDIIKKYGLTYNICYLHNIYGNLTKIPKKNKMVIDNFIDCYYYKQKACLINNGKQKRIFTHISDVIKFMILCLDLDLPEVNLIKRNSMYSIKEIADILNLQTYNVDSTLYSLEDPYILPLNDLENIWSETIDVKDWLLTNIIL
jgi:UDP-glucose 4-epimerase